MSERKNRSTKKQSEAKQSEAAAVEQQQSEATQSSDAATQEAAATQAEQSEATQQSEAAKQQQALVEKMIAQAERVQSFYNEHLAAASDAITLREAIDIIRLTETVERKSDYVLIAETRDSDKENVSQGWYNTPRERLYRCSIEQHVREDCARDAREVLADLLFSFHTRRSIHKYEKIAIAAFQNLHETEKYNLKTQQQRRSIVNDINRKDYQQSAREKLAAQEAAAAKRSSKRSSSSSDASEADSLQALLNAAVAEREAKK